MFCGTWVNGVYQEHTLTSTEDQSVPEDVAEEFNIYDRVWNSSAA